MAITHTKLARERLKTLATNITNGSTLTILAANIHLGRRAWDNENPEPELPLKTPELIIQPAGLAEFSGSVYMTVIANLKIALDATDAQPFTDVEDLVESLAETWKNISNYPDTEQLTSMEWDEPTVESTPEKYVIEYRFRLRMTNPLNT